MFKNTILMLTDIQREICQKLKILGHILQKVFAKFAKTNFYDIFMMRPKFAKFRKKPICGTKQVQVLRGIAYIRGKAMTTYVMKTALGVED